MKKIIILVLVLTVLFPFSVYADDGDTAKLYMNIDILENGDIKVRELASLEGEYNGRLRSIAYKNSSLKDFSGEVEDFEGSSIYNGSSIEDILIADVSDREKINFNSLFDESIRSNPYVQVNSGVNGMKRVYTEFDEGDGVSLKIYNPSSTETAFYMEYVIKDAVVVHNDVAELAWNILGDTYEDNINDLEVRVNLPLTDSSMRVWLRGPLNGNIEKVDNKYARITYDFLGARNAISTRIVFDKNLVLNAVKHSHVDALPSILEVEKRASDKANRIRSRIKRQNNMVKIVSYIWYLVLFVFFIKFLLYKKKNEECSFNAEYLRDFPYDYGPDVLEYLLDKNITEKSMSASILMIIEKKALRVEKNTDKKNNYTLVKQEENSPKLTKEENILFSLLIDKIGDGSKVTLNEIKKYGNNYKNANKMMSSYNKWKSTCLINARSYDFYRGNVKPKIYLIVVTILGMIIGSFNFILETGSLLGYILPVVSLALLIIGAFSIFRTEKGVLHRKKWLALKKFMIDFGAMDIKELPEISIWGKYLVYATVFGCAKQLEKTMKIKIEEINSDASLARYYMLDSFYDNYIIMSTLSSSINNSIVGAISSSRSSIASSTSSSSTGGGGGASFGGGSFGGGSGGGHF